MLPARAYALAFVSTLAGASVVHWTFAPDLRVPRYGASATTRAS